MKQKCLQCGSVVLYQGAEFCSPRCYGIAYGQQHCVRCKAAIDLVQEDQLCTECRVGTGEWRAAQISDCGAFCYLLARVWAPPPWALFIGLNPSKADAERDDPTVQRWRRFAQIWEFGGFVVGNLSAFRATDSRDLEIAGYPVGEGNDRYINEAADLCDRVVACWGSAGGEWALERGREIRTLLEGREVWSWGLNSDGNPRHPIARGKNRVSDAEPLQRMGDL